MYKIIQNEKVIDVVKEPHFFRLLANGNVAFTNKASATGIVGSDKQTLYAFAPVKTRELAVVTIEKITLEELDRLQGLLSSGQKPSADESLLVKAKTTMINRLSSVCQNRITSGFSIKLSDGNEYNFKLTPEDQLNLLAIENQLNSGATTFLYHATNQPCKFFSKEDMINIISVFKRYTLYHTTYFNIAKQYINSLVDISKVNLFVYGDDVSSMTDDVVIKQILKNGGNLT
jgi:hypothetical protein